MEKKILSFKTNHINMYKQISVLAYLAICFTDLSIFAQRNNVRFDHISINDGLSNSYVTCILQDRKGFMWFGTKDGLNKFDGYKFTVFRNDPSNSNSLSDNSIQSIIETKDGILWIGTKNGGLNRFNPSTEIFTHFKHEPDNMNSLSHNNVWTLYKDPDLAAHVLWVGTVGGGLNKFDYQSNTFTHYTHNQKNNNSISNNYIRTIYKDSDELLWVGTDSGLNIYDIQNNNWQHFFHDPENPLSIDNSRVKVIYQDSDGLLWIGTDNGLNKVIRNNPIEITLFNNKENIGFEKFTKRDDIKRLPIYTVNTIFEDWQGCLWFGNYYGLYRYDKNSDELRSFNNHKEVPSSISGDIVSTIYQGEAENLWIGTRGAGINHLDLTPKQFHNIRAILTDISNFSKPSIRGIIEDSDEVLWVGGYEGLRRIERAGNQVTSYNPNNSKNFSVYIYAICEDNIDKQVLWLGSEGGGLIQFNIKTKSSKIYTVSPDKKIQGLSDRFIFDLYIDSNGFLWIATGGGINRFDRKSGEFTYFQHDPGNALSLSDNRTRVICEDHNGLLWVGTETGGLNCFDGQSNKFTRYRNDPENPNSLSIDRIESIFEDSKNRLWIGTNGGGLNLYDRTRNSFKRYTVQDGLPNNVVYGILEDDNNNLWLSTGLGLSRFNPESETFRNYDVNDGLQSNEFNAGSYFKSASGEMFFGGINGLNTFFPDSIKDDLHVPQINITDFQLNNISVPIGQTAKGRTILDKHISEKQEIRLSYKDNLLSFEFVGLSYIAPEKNKYAYILTDVDQAWVYTDAHRRFANYTNLDPGNYTFKVKGANHDGVWNEKATSLHIIISPPPWKTWWAYTLYLIVVVGGIVGIIEWRVIKDRLEKRRLELLVKERTVKIEKQNRKIEAQAEKLIESDKMKSRFFANISHEFRTPLTLIKGPLESFRNEKYGKITKMAAKHLDLSLNNIDRLQKLIGELLDMSKLEAGKLKLEAVSANLVTFLQRIIEPFYSAAHNKDIDLTFKSDRKNINLYFDEIKLEKAITNLLSNALKFTPAGGKIRVIICDSTEDKNDRGTGHFVSIAVSDTGIGIPQKAISRVFDRFYQVEDSKTRRFEGTGIGLAITKEFVELHGGEIAVQTLPEAGTIFKIILPKGRAHLADDEILHKSPSESKTDEADIDMIKTDDSSSDEQTDLLAIDVDTKKRCEILIVEDNDELRTFLKDHLFSTYTIVEAVNGKEGLEKAFENYPDLIISDIMMPEMDGMEMVSELKRHESMKTIPIILLTARADIADRLAGLETHADDYITKPFDLDELIIKINNLIDNRILLKKQYSRKVSKVELDKLDIDSADKQFLEKVFSVAILHLSDSDFNVQFLANSMFVSKRTLERKINFLTGLSPAGYIRAIRLNRAKQYLQEKTFSTVSEAATKAGFSNVKYFSRLYKQTFGTPPGKLLHKP